MRIAIASLLAALAASPAWACSTVRSPGGATLESLMARTVWTVETSAIYCPTREDTHGQPALHRQRDGCMAQVRIALPSMIRYPTCESATWDVELVLPEGVSMRADDAGNAGPSSYEGLAISATALFEIVADPSPAEIRRERAWLQVTVRNSAGRALRGYNTRWPDYLFHYPVTVNVGAARPAE